MNVKKKLKNLKAENSLKNYVIDYFLDEDNVKQQMKDLKQYGCQSGMIGTLIYYRDTEEFYNKYKDEINELANELVYSTGYESLFELIPTLDKDDQLMLKPHNQNILAWFGFEETSNKLYEELFEGRDRSDEMEVDD